MDAATLAADTTKANAPSALGQFLTARQMALKPHNLSKDGMEAHAADGGLWKWAPHFNVWACLENSHCPGCDTPSRPATWKPLTYEGVTRDCCPACHADQAQLQETVGA